MYNFALFTIMVSSPQSVTFHIGIDRIYKIPLAQPEVELRKSVLLSQYPKAVLISSIPAVLETVLNFTAGG